MKDNIFQEQDQTAPKPADKENIYTDQRFAFNSQVATVFDDMISRSVPGYSAVQSIIADMSIQLTVKPGTIYDFGCSTGTSLINIAQKIKEYRRDFASYAAHVKLVGIDYSPDMILKALDKASAFDCQDMISFAQGDVRTVIPQNSPLTICLYTLQFLAPFERAAVIKNIWRGLFDEGVFIFAEKVKHSSSTLNDIVVSKYDDYKRQNGYSNVEIMRKRQALEHVLIPFTVDQNIELLKEAGFRRVEIIQKDLSFVSFLAEK